MFAGIMLNNSGSRNCGIWYLAFCLGRNLHYTLHPQSCTKRKVNGSAQLRKPNSWSFVHDCLTQSNVCHRSIFSLYIFQLLPQYFKCNCGWAVWRMSLQIKSTGSSICLIMNLAGWPEASHALIGLILTLDFALGHTRNAWGTVWHFMMRQPCWSDVGLNSLAAWMGDQLVALWFWAVWKKDGGKLWSIEHSTCLPFRVWRGKSMENWAHVSLRKTLGSLLANASKYIFVEKRRESRADVVRFIVLLKMRMRLRNSE